MAVNRKPNNPRSCGGFSLDPPSSAVIGMLRTSSWKNAVNKSDKSPTRDIKLEVSDAAGFLRRYKAGTANLIVTSPPYFMGKEYDRSAKLEDFEADHKQILP